DVEAIVVTVITGVLGRVPHHAAEDAVVQAGVQLDEIGILILAELVVDRTQIVADAGIADFTVDAGKHVEVGLARVAEGAAEDTRVEAAVEAVGALQLEGAVIARL